MTDPTPQTTPTRDEAVLSVDALAQEIRRVDGSHSLGAGALAEALMPFLLASAPAPASGGADAVAFTDDLRRRADAADAECRSDDADAIRASSDIIDSHYLMVASLQGQLSAALSALRPFAEAIEGNDDDKVHNSANIWEAPIAMQITYGNLRAAKLASLSPAATPVSEAGGEAVKVLATLNRMVTDYLVPDTYKARFPKDSTLWEREFPMPDRHHSDAGAALVHQRRDAAFIRDVIHLQDNPTGVEPSEPDALAKPASSPAGVPCRHEPYQGACIHCGLRYENGRPVALDKHASVPETPAASNPQSAGADEYAGQTAGEAQRAPAVASSPAGGDVREAEIREIIRRTHDEVANDPSYVFGWEAACSTLGSRILTYLSQSTSAGRGDGDA